MRYGVCMGMFCVMAVQGCTLTGMGIGAGVEALTNEHYEGKRYEDVQLRRGQRVVLTTRTRRRLAGTYDGHLAPTASDPRGYAVLALEGTDGVLTRVPTDDVVQVDALVPGKGWLYGGIVGAVIDVALVVTFAVWATNWHMEAGSVPAPN